MVVQPFVENFSALEVRLRLMAAGGNINDGIENIYSKKTTRNDHKPIKKLCNKVLYSLFICNGLMCRGFRLWPKRVRYQ